MADVWTARVEAGNVLAVEAGGPAEVAAVGRWVGRRSRKETSCLLSLRLWMAKAGAGGGGAGFEEEMDRATLWVLADLGTFGEGVVGLVKEDG